MLLLLGMKPLRDAIFVEQSWKWFCKQLGARDRGGHIYPRVRLKSRMFSIGFRTFSGNCLIHTRNRSHKQYSLSDTIFNYMFYFGPPGKHLSKSAENLLHVSRLRRPTCSGFWGFNCRYVPGDNRNSRAIAIARLQDRAEGEHSHMVTCVPYK